MTKDYPQNAPMKRTREPSWNETALSTRTSVVYGRVYLLARRRVDPEEQNKSCCPRADRGRMNMSRGNFSRQIPLGIEILLSQISHRASSTRRVLVKTSALDAAPLPILLKSLMKCVGTSPPLARSTASQYHCWQQNAGSHPSVRVSFVQGRGSLKLRPLTSVALINLPGSST